MARLLVEIIQEKVGKKIKTAMFCDSVKITPDTDPITRRGVIHINNILAAEGAFSDIKRIYNTLVAYMVTAENQSCTTQLAIVTQVRLEDNQLIVIDGVKNLNE
jgi:hypothetical protein